MLVLTMMTRSGCHLCDRMKEVIARVGRTHPLRLDEVDISADPELERRYGVAIPVLLVAGREIARHRIDEADLAKRLERLAV
jgi:hypothetical protein